MTKYEEIHIWRFPPTRTFVSLDDSFRVFFFSELTKNRSYRSVAFLLNKISLKYGARAHHRNSNVLEWKNGSKVDRNRVVRINIPLWALIEMSKMISTDHKFLAEVEKNIVSYRGRGTAKSIYSPKLPLLLTPK